MVFLSGRPGQEPRSNEMLNQALKDCFAPKDDWINNSQAVQRKLTHCKVLRLLLYRIKLIAPAMQQSIRAVVPKPKYTMY